MEANDCSWLAWREKSGRLVPTILRSSTLHADECRLVIRESEDETNPNAAGEKRVKLES